MGGTLIALIFLSGALLDATLFQNTERDKLSKYLVQNYFAECCIMLPGESFSCPLCKIHLRKSVTSPQGDIPQSPAGQDDKPCLFL